MKGFITTILAALIFAACGNAQDASTTSAQAGTFEDLKVQEFLTLYGEKENAQLLDVRTPAETDKGIIQEAMIMDFFADDFKTKLATLDKSQPLFVYCASGGRSGKTLKMAKEMGFSEVYNMLGGYSAYASQK